MSNPYAIMKQVKPQVPAPQPVPATGSTNSQKPLAANPQYTSLLPEIDRKHKDKMGKSMKRRMSVSHNNIDMNKILQQQQVKGNQPALPMGLLNQYKSNESNILPGSNVTNTTSTTTTRENSYSVPVSDSDSNIGGQRSIRTFGTQRNVSGAQLQLGSDSYKSNNNSSNGNGLNRGIDLHDPKMIKLLHDPNFDPESFISLRLSDATATDIERFSSNLVALHKKFNTEMKSTALKTYDRLVSTSNELLATESELKVLRNVIADLLEVSNTMKQTAERRVQLELEKTNGLSSKSARGARRVDRSSVLMLEKIWNNEMNSLFKHVEGAQKFITPIPSRHIVAECGRWYELNAATFKTLQPAHIFLLNDLILIATRRRKNAIITANSNDSKSNTGLIAEQCWPLRDATLTEIKLNNHQVPGENTYAIKITYNSLTYIYQTDRRDHFQLILNGYKKSRDALRDIIEAENIKQKELRDSLNMLSIPESIQPSTPSKRSSSSQKDNHALLNDLSTKMHGRSRSLDNSNSIRNLKLIDDSLNDVDILIFHENFNATIDKLEELTLDLDTGNDKLNSEETLFRNVILMKIDLKRDELLKKLINLINSGKTNTEAEIEKIINSLIKLNHAPIAQTLFLQNRSLYLNSLTANIHETKDLIGNPKLVKYLIENSIVVFQTVKNTIITYKAFFKSVKSSNLAYLIQWGTKQVKEHLQFLQRKINNLAIQRDEMENLVLILHRQSNNLKDVGLDVEYALDQFYKSINSS